MGDIRKIHRRSELELKDQVKRAKWQEVLDFFGMGPPPVIPKKANLRISVTSMVTSAELKTLIAEWEKNGGDLQSDDYGFQFKGEQDVHWLSGARASKTITLQVTRDPGNNQVDAEALLTSIVAAKKEILKVMS